MPTLKGTDASLPCVQCFLYLVSSSTNDSFSCYMAGYLWTDPIYNFFIHLFVKQTLRLFHTLAIVNNTAVNVGVQTSLQNNAFVSLHPEVELLDHIVVPSLIS